MSYNNWDSSSSKKNKSQENNGKSSFADDVKFLQDSLNELSNNEDVFDFTASSSLEMKDKNDSKNNKTNSSVDNSLNLSYLLKQSTLIPENNSGKNSPSSSNINNSNNKELNNANKSIKRENNLENSSISKKVKVENVNNSNKTVTTSNSTENLLNSSLSHSSESINMIPQIPSYEYSINPTYNPYQNPINYPNVGIYNPLLPNAVPQAAQYYLLPNKNQVPAVVPNYQSGNSSPQLSNAYVNINPLNIANLQNATQIPPQIPPQISPQIATQISSQIPPQLTTQLSPQLTSQLTQQITTPASQLTQQITTPATQLPIQPVSNIFPIFNMKKNSSTNQNNQKKEIEKESNNNVIDLTENPEKKDNVEIDENTLDIDASIENDTVKTLLDKIRIAQKKQEYYYNLSIKYTEFINKVNLRLLSLQESKVYEEPKKDKMKGKMDEDLMIEIKQEIKQEEKPKKTVEEKIVEDNKKPNKKLSTVEKRSSHSEKSSDSDKRTDKSETTSSSSKPKYEVNVISAPPLEEQIMNIVNQKKRTASEITNSLSKKLKSSSPDPYNSNKPSSSSNSLTYNDNASSKRRRSPERAGYNIRRNSSSNNNLNNSYTTSQSQSQSQLNSFSQNRAQSQPISSMKTTNQNNEITEIKVNSQNSKTRLFARDIGYIKKITDRKPRKYIHFKKSNNMIVTSLGGEILIYNTKSKEEIKSLHAPTGGWPEDICSFSDYFFATSTSNKNKSETQLALISLKNGINNAKLHTFKSEKPHDSGSVRIAPVGDSYNSYKLLSAGADHKIFLWTINEEEKEVYKPTVSFVHERHTSAIQTVCYNSWNDTVYSGGSDCKLFGFNLNTRRTNFSKRYDMRISNILRNPVDVNQLLVMSSSTKDQFRICDIRNKKTVLNFGIPTNENVTQYAYPDFHKDGYLISFGSQNTDERDKASVYIWDIRYINPSNTYVSEIKLSQGRIIKPLFHPSKKQIITIDTNGKAAFIDYQMVYDP